MQDAEQCVDTVNRLVAKPVTFDVAVGSDVPLPEPPLPRPETRDRPVQVHLDSFVVSTQTIHEVVPLSCVQHSVR